MVARNIEQQAPRALIGHGRGLAQEVSGQSIWALSRMLGPNHARFGDWTDSMSFSGLPTIRTEPFTFVLLQNHRSRREDRNGLAFPLSM